MLFSVSFSYGAYYLVPSFLSQPLPPKVLTILAASARNISLLSLTSSADLLVMTPFIMQSWTKFNLQKIFIYTFLSFFTILCSKLIKKVYAQGAPLVWDLIKQSNYSLLVQKSLIDSLLMHDLGIKGTGGRGSSYSQERVENKGQLMNVRPSYNEQNLGPLGSYLVELKFDAFDFLRAYAKKQFYSLPLNLKGLSEQIRSQTVSMVVFYITIELFYSQPWVDQSSDCILGLRSAIKASSSGVTSTVIFLLVGLDETLEFICCCMSTQALDIQGKCPKLIQPILVTTLSSFSKVLILATTSQTYSMGILISISLLDELKIMFFYRILRMPFTYFF